MKRSVRLTLGSICAVIITLCCVALGLYTFDYMGFEDGKLKFYFGQQVEEPQEPEEPVVTGRTIHLVWKDLNKSSDYTYDPDAGETFSPKIQETWIRVQEISKKYYRFVGWYTDEDFTTEVKISRLRDGDTLYAQMIEQVSIVINNSDPLLSFQTKDVRKDIGAEFDINGMVSVTSAQIIGMYEDKAKTIETEGQFIALTNRTIYLEWSTPYTYFDFTIDGDTATLKDYNINGKFNTVIVPSEYRPQYNKVYTVTAIGSSAFKEARLDLGFNMNDMTAVIIPDTITSIGKEAFYDCKKLQSVTISATIPPTLGSNAFYNCTSLSKIYVPAESVDAYKNADGWSSYSDKIFAINE